MLNIVIVQNHGSASIGALSESLGSQRFGTNYRYRDAGTGMLDGGTLPVDLAANAESLGAEVIRVGTIGEFRAAIARSRASTRTTAIHIEPTRSLPCPRPGTGGTFRCPRWRSRTARGRPARPTRRTSRCRDPLIGRNPS